MVDTCHWQGETCASGDSIEISQDNGRDLYTNWTDEYYYKATRMGTFWDKYICALVDDL